MADKTHQLSGQVSPAGSSGGGEWITIIQADRLVDEEPKNDFAFWQWVRAEGYYDRIYSSDQAIDSTILIEQLKDQFYGPCDEASGSTIMIGLKVIKSHDHLDPTVIESYGLLHFNRRVEDDAELHIDVPMTDKIEIRDHRVEELLRQNGQVGVWEGMPFTADGRQTRTPSGGEWDAETQTIYFDQPYLGTFLFKFREEYDSYSIAIPPRVNCSDIYDLNEVYDCTVRGFCLDSSGDPLLAECAIEIPEDARECLQYMLDENGNTVIVPGGTYSYDFDGDGEVDVVTDDPCLCFFCGGDGLIDGCQESATVSCQCPVCEGSGRYPGCDEYSETSGTGSSDDDGGSSSSSGDDDREGYGDCYRLKVKRHRCTDEILEEYPVKIPCP